MEQKGGDQRTELWAEPGEVSREVHGWEAGAGGGWVRMKRAAGGGVWFCPKDVVCKRVGSRCLPVSGSSREPFTGLPLLPDPGL